MVKHDEQVSKQTYQLKMKKHFFRQWYEKILEKQSEEEYRAITFHRKKCLKRYFTMYYTVSSIDI